MISPVKKKLGIQRKDYSNNNKKTTKENTKKDRKESDRWVTFAEAFPWAVLMEETGLRADTDVMLLLLDR